MTRISSAEITFPLVTSEWLATHLDDPSLRVVDTRKGDGYAAAHVPGAVSIGESPFLRADGDVLGKDAFERRMSTLGIGQDTTVVAYDDANNLFAGRLWWALNHYGHTRVMVLDGGWDAWVAEGRPCGNEPISPPVTHFEATPLSRWIADSAYVEASIDRKDRVLLDVRSDEEWQRLESSSKFPAGHIPGAVHLVWTDVIDPTSKRFKSVDELNALFSEVGIRRDQEIITYCLGGIRAAHSVLALVLAGFHSVRNYEGSWAAWSVAGLPTEAASTTIVGPSTPSASE